MIPEDFGDFFISSEAGVQQQIVSLEEVKLVDTQQQKSVTSPHCSSNKVRANGKLKGFQRYYCKDCKKNFSKTTGKFWFGLREER